MQKDWAGVANYALLELNSTAISQFFPKRPELNLNDSWTRERIFPNLMLQFFWQSRERRERLALD